VAAPISGLMMMVGSSGEVSAIANDCPSCCRPGVVGSAMNAGSAVVTAPLRCDVRGAATQAEPAFIAEPTTAGLEQLGQSFVIVDTSPLDPSIKISPNIGAATGLEFLGDGRILAAAEPVRRGGGSAGVLVPSR